MAIKRQDKTLTQDIVDEEQQQQQQPCGMNQPALSVYVLPILQAAQMVIAHIAEASMTRHCLNISSLDYHSSLFDMVPSLSHIMKYEKVPLAVEVWPLHLY